MRKYRGAMATQKTGAGGQVVYQATPGLKIQKYRAYRLQN